MSEKDQPDETFRIKVADGANVQVRCPVCGTDKFGSARPHQDERRLGFQHVIVGREFKDGMPGQSMTLPVRFKFCLNCGFVLKFILGQGEADWGEDQT